MKKLFSFRSSSANKNNNPPATDKQVYWESISDYDKTESNFHTPKDLVLKSRKQIQDSQNCSSTGPGLRRSRSLSSTAFLDHDGPGGKNVLSASKAGKESSSSSFSSGSHHSSRRRALTPEIHRRQKGSYFIVQTGQAIERPRDISSGNSLFPCSNTSNNVLDLYIDSEQQQEKSRSKNNSQRNNRLPPRVHDTISTSPTGSVADNKPRAHSFRECTKRQENGFGHESPRRLAKNVVARLSKTHALPKSKSREFDRGVPITIEDIYDEFTPQTNYSMDETDKDIDVELKKRSIEAEDRFMFFSKELEQERFLLDCGFDVPSLIQTVRNLSEQRVSLAHEISSLVQSRISERASAKEEVRSVKVELDSRTRRLEKEKNELQSSLEKELDRRSTDWSFKLKKYQTEEHRLRERVRELAEQNVSLQRELSLFHEREAEFQHLTASVTQLSDENQDLRMNLVQVQENNRAVEEDFDCLKRNFKEKEKECGDLQKSVSRLARMCGEQEKTVEGLREGVNEEIRKKQPLEKFDKYVAKLQMEQIRLTGIELGLRKELESYRLEVDSLRNENVNLLSRLKVNGSESVVLTFKLDKEMWDRVCCLQNQGVSMLNESTQMCSKLLEFIKQDVGFVKNGLDGQFMVESEMKVQSFKHGTENLTRSLHTLSGLLHEKSDLGDCLPPGKDIDGLRKLNCRTQEEMTRVELKTETLLTSLLKEKLYSTEMEVEQLQAELAAAVRGNDILRSEVQNAQNELSCASHKFKELELQTIKKDENINRLEISLQEHAKELSILRGMLPKLSEERDLIWEEAKQSSEKNGILNSEVNALKKKIEALEEDILLKEGQVTILKDALRKRPFSILASPDSTQDFL